MTGRVEQMVDLMREFQRPFGHRLGRAIMAYAANYPEIEGGRGVDDALADQVEMRLLPKLRGVEVDMAGAAIFQLDDLCRARSWRRPSGRGDRRVRATVRGHGSVRVERGLTLMRLLTRPWSAKSLGEGGAFGPKDCLLGEFQGQAPRGLEYATLLSGMVRDTPMGLALVPYPRRDHAVAPEREGFPVRPRFGHDPVTESEKEGAAPFGT